MNKGDLVNQVAKVTSTKKEAQAAVDCVFSTITKAL
ncbi:MAG: DNA-binding protein, partial [Desulfobacterales bacterium]|nr:DNA-binding protein [Desulfobacterales bacterium]